MSVSTKTSTRVIQITNATRSVDVSNAMVHFRYYESLFSPYVSATFEYVDTGAIKASTEDDFSNILQMNNNSIFQILCASFD